MTILQLLLGTTASTRILNVAINALALCTFWWWGLLSWMPPRRFDLRDIQYVPGRSYLLRNSRRICRHAGVGIDTIRDRTVTLTNGTTIRDADLSRRRLAQTAGGGKSGIACPRGRMVFPRSGS